MSEHKKENPGRGLSDEDLSLIFPEPDSMSEVDTQPQSPKPAAPLYERDFKKLASGERDDDLDLMPVEREVKAPTLNAGHGISEQPVQIAVHTERKKLPPTPSDETWFMELEKILEGMP
jgi:hypothetical protein